MSTDQSPAPFAALKGEQFVVLTTHRATGAPVPTTVWFADAGGVIYVTTTRTAGKVKRIGADPRVLLTPSDRVGNTHGAALEGRARILAPEENAPALAALRAKYPEFDAVASRTNASPSNERVFVAITPA